jgi:hypothetical protein
MYFARIRLRWVLATLLLWCMSDYGLTAFAQDFTTALMQSTFQIVGPASNGRVGEFSTGTVFVLGKPVPGKPGQTIYTLITAAHVLDGIGGDTATLQLRTKKGDGTYQALPQQLNLRRGALNLYVKHPSADIAVMHVALPDGIIPKVIGTEFLVNDAELDRIEVHPGDTLFCLGFPLSIDLNTFSVLRTGILASYPITPAKVVKSYYYNFVVFPGNSGGPVFYIFENRRFGNAMMNVGLQIGIIGLVSQSVSAANQKLDISIIVPAAFIREAIDLLPTPM